MDHPKGVPRSCSIVACGVGIGLVFGPSTLTANWAWAPPVQITHADSFPQVPSQYSQVQSWQIAFGRQSSSDRQFHLVVQVAPNEQHGGYTQGVVAYEHVGEDLDWETALANKEWIYGGLNVTHSWIPVLAVDPTDVPHVVEGANWADVTALALAYRQRGTPTWAGETADPVLFPCSGEPSGITITEASNPDLDTLRVGFGTYWPPEAPGDPCGVQERNGWVRYTKAARSTAADGLGAWSEWVWADSLARGTPFLGDDGGPTLHRPGVGLGDGRW